MANSELLDRVRELRTRGRTPKEIARALGMRPAEVTPLIQAVATTLPERVTDTLIGCQVTEGWAAGLTVTGHPDWPGVNDTAADAGNGLVTVVVARDRGSKASVCSYLVDTWCLGVKDAIGPKSVDRRKLPGLTSVLFSPQRAQPMPIPLDLAQQLVLGAIAHARSLGFEPHPDFAACAGHLGTWDERCDITFGRHGQPFYIPGPHDDQAEVLHTLSRRKRR